MHSLTSPTQTITAQLAGAKTTTEVQIIATWEDVPLIQTAPGGQPVEGVQTTLTTGIAAVTIVPAPPANLRRKVTKLTILNQDTVAQTPSIKFADSSASAPAATATIFAPVLQTLESAQYDQGAGWSCLDVNGALKSQAAATSSASSTADSKALSVSLNTSIADSKGVSSGTQASTADSKAVSDSVVISANLSTGTAQSTTASSATSSAAAAASTADSKAVSDSAAVSTTLSGQTSAGVSVTISKTKSSFGF